ncbi:MAG: nucleotidyltransferase domain-containing protein [Pseudomonadota bacterium]
MAIDPSIRTAAEALVRAGEIDALFLAGSHGRGAADGFSDIDLVALAPAERRETILETWRQALAAEVTLVYWQAYPWGLSNAITDLWRRVDLYVVPPERFGTRSRANVKPLHDPDGIWDSLPATLPPATPSAASVERLTREFIRVLGLMPVALGRGEWVLLVRGTGLLRDMLVDLMIETSPEPDRGGALHPSRLLTPDQIATLEALPYPRPDRAAVIDAHLKIAAVFLPLARRLYRDTGLDWPEPFEAAMWTHLATAGIIPE